MKEKGFTKKQIITIILGFSLTIFSFCLYFLLNISWLNILCGVACFLHMIFLMFFQLANKKEFTQKQRILYPSVLLVAFYGALIALIALLDPLEIFCLDYILWVSFIGASIIPVFYLLLFIISFAP